MDQIHQKPEIIPAHYHLAESLEQCRKSRNIKILDEKHQLKTQGDYYLLKQAFQEKKIKEKEFMARLQERIRRGLVWVDQV